MRSDGPGRQMAAAVPVWAAPLRWGGRQRATSPDGEGSVPSSVWHQSSCPFVAGLGAGSPILAHSYPKRVASHHRGIMWGGQRLSQAPHFGRPLALRSVPWSLMQKAIRNSSVSPQGKAGMPYRV